MILRSFFFSMALLLSNGAGAYDDKAAKLPADAPPIGMENVGITEHLGERLTLDLPVVDEEGHARKLSDYFHSGKPVIFSLVYYSCQALCNYHLNGLFDALKEVDWNPGDKFEVVALSFDPKETSDVGRPKRLNYLKEYARPAGDKGIHFLTASAGTIETLTGQAGFKYKWNEAGKEWMHASAAVLVSPEGVITRYLHGIQFSARDVKLALMEAVDGKTGTLVDKMVWYCSAYDPKKSKYTVASFRLVQLGGAVAAILLALVLAGQWLKSRGAKA